MNNFFLETHQVVKRFANHTALNGVSIQVPEGQIFGLLGPNGAGKTTLIRIINRITAPDSGEVRFNGHLSQAEDYRLSTRRTRIIQEDESGRTGYLPGSIERSQQSRSHFTTEAMV